MTEPLPPSVRAVRPGTGDDPTSVELHDLAPVVRTGSVADIGQVRTLRARLAGLTELAGLTGPAGDAVAEPAAWAVRLLDRASRDAPRLTVAARWHGDLAPWNTARDATGTLWVWDWESCEPDAPAGLDALHWAFSVHRETAGPGGIRLADCLTDAAPHLTALGAARRTWPALLRIYLAVTIERACGLAAADGGWQRLWIQPDQLYALTGQADDLTVTS
ncbi:hypothetical protein [Nocardioides sp. TF02-7]|uniref:hypothetical protein n=1 Tax=Nocardioides sp. TF02-7 TaxID=2917724 RepID=UPI001F069D2A|nr:hypothetical protein [Nocardioides sp. TF02-7]UMG91344.1 hypothetical protein MF408_14385 [Nocardioides sp. TF02-7]